MELLKQLYKIHSPSNKEWAMTKFILNYVKKIRGCKVEIDDTGNLYITKGGSESCPCIVAHLDQVQQLHSRDFKVIETEDIIIGYSPKHRRLEGLGSDNKSGLWIALKCLEKYDTLKIAFFVCEELGCIGSSRARMSFFDDCRFVIEPDRRGYQDIITEIGWTPLCSPEFLEATGYKKFGYRETTGMMTDVQVLKENGLAVSCINLSCGYYEPHTDHEFTVKKDLLNCLRLVEHIIENCTSIYPHKNEGLYYGNLNEELWEEVFSILDEKPSMTLKELIDIYQSSYPFCSEEELEEAYNEYVKLNTVNDYEDKKILS